MLSSTIAFAFLTTSFVYFTITSVALSNVLSTPVSISILSLPASFTLPHASANSPLNKCPNAFPKCPKVSNKLSKRSIKLSFIALPKSLILCVGFSNISLKKPVIVPILFSKNENKSLKAIDKLSIAILKISKTF